MHVYRSSPLNIIHNVPYSLTSSEYSGDLLHSLIFTLSYLKSLAGPLLPHSKILTIENAAKLSYSV